MLYIFKVEHHIYPVQAKLGDQRWTERISKNVNETSDSPFPVKSVFSFYKPADSG